MQGLLFKVFLVESPRTSSAMQYFLTSFSIVSVMIHAFI